MSCRSDWALRWRDFLAVRAMARRAVLSEKILAALGPKRIIGKAGKRAHIVRHVLGPLSAQCSAQGRHHAHASANDRGLDGVGFTIQPVVVGQIRETLGAACIGAMALRAIGQERRPPMAFASGSAATAFRSCV